MLTISKSQWYCLRDIAYGLKLDGQMTHTDWQIHCFNGAFDTACLTYIFKFFVVVTVLKQESKMTELKTFNFKYHVINQTRI